MFTNSSAAVERAIYELRINGREDAEKIAVFMTDGIVDTGDAAADVAATKWMRDDLTAEASELDIKIFGIAFTENADFQLIQSLARRTGARYFRATTADDLETVFTHVHEALEEAAEELEAKAQAAVEELEAAKAAEEAAVRAAQEATLLAEAEAAARAAAEQVAKLAKEQAAKAAADAERKAQEAAAKAAQTATRQANAQAAAQAAAQQEAETKPDIVWLLLVGGGSVVVLIGLVMIVKAFRGSSGDGTSGHKVAQPEAFLRDMSGISGLDRHELKSPFVNIGRIPSGLSGDIQDIVIDLKTVGRQHAAIEFKEHSYWLRDQSSLNGTFLNGSRIETEVRLSHGDLVAFHDHEFRFAMPSMQDSDKTVMAGDEGADGDRTVLAGGDDLGAEMEPAESPEYADDAVRHLVDEYKKRRID